MGSQDDGYRALFLPVIIRTAWIAWTVIAAIETLRRTVAAIAAGRVATAAPIDMCRKPRRGSRHRRGRGRGPSDRACAREAGQRIRKRTGPDAADSALT